MKERDMDFSELIEKRFSARSYTRDPVSDEAIDRILQAIDSAPSAGNLQSYLVAVVRDESMRTKLMQASVNQEWMVQASVFLVFFADLDQFMSRYGRRHIDTMPLQDATIAITYAQLAAHDMGLVTCWVGTFAEDYAQKICGLKGDLQFAGILTLGYTKARRPRRYRRGPDDWSVKL